MGKSPLPFAAMSESTDDKTITEQAIELAGGAARIGRHFNISTQAVIQWEGVPPLRVMGVSALIAERFNITGRALLPHEIRPDLPELFPAPANVSVA